MKWGKLKLIMVIFPLLTGACASSIGAGAAAGTAAGAGIGAIAGAAISRGDVLGSALLGGAIGLPLGILISYQMQKNKEAELEQQKVAQYMRNQQLIVDREKEIEALRYEVLSDAPTETPKQDPDYLYMGPSLGNSFR